MSHPASQRSQAATPALPAWNLDALWRMDWKRFQELVSLMLARSGMLSEILWVRPDGATVLAVYKGRRRKTGEALLQCPAWHTREVTTSEILGLHHAVSEQGAVRGIFVTPGQFDSQALVLGQQRKIELIDGEEFLRTIGRMTLEDQITMQRMALSGSWDVPSCPSCQTRLVYAERHFPQGEAAKDLRDITYKESKQVGTQIFCRHLVINAEANILFLKGVEAESIHVEGRIMGNIVCRGKLTVASGATVSGLVAARSIKLEPGGLLEADSRILDAKEIRPVLPQPLQAFWKCPKDRCQGSLPIKPAL